MNIKKFSNKNRNKNRSRLCLDINVEVIKKFNIYHQYLQKMNQVLVLEGYSRIKRSKNELEK